MGNAVADLKREIRDKPNMPFSAPRSALKLARVIHDITEEDKRSIWMLIRRLREDLGITTTDDNNSGSDDSGDDDDDDDDDEEGGGGGGGGGGDSGYGDSGVTGLDAIIDHDDVPASLDTPNGRKCLTGLIAQWLLIKCGKARVKIKYAR
ncbi:hypothetical protein ACOMHN_001033 [Nucella lapillus]